MPLRYYGAFMQNPDTIFIKISAEWSYRYIGAMKEFIPLDTLVLSKLYNIACMYVVLRHNFIWGHIDNQRYTALVADLFRPFQEGPNTAEASTVKYYCEDLYRLFRPVLDAHPRMLIQSLFWNDDAGEVVGSVFSFVKHTPITTLQFS